jgi:hypothetical protein
LWHTSLVVSVHGHLVLPPLGLWHTVHHGRCVWKKRYVHLVQPGSKESGGEGQGPNIPFKITSPVM